MEGLSEVFSGGGERRTRDHESEVRDLHAKIGELIVERDFFVTRVGSLIRAERRAMVVRDHPALSLTDEEWEAIGAGALRAGNWVSTWAAECALTVDPLPRKSRRLVLDEKQQRFLSRSMEAHARSLCADPDAPGVLADGLRALLAKRLGAMAREGRHDDSVALLREMLGDRRAEIVIAAMMPESVETVEPEKKAVEVVERPVARKPRRKSRRDGSD